MGSLDSAKAVVTGGGSGIGHAVCRLLADLGAAVAILDADGDRAEAVAREVGGRAFAVDVVDADAVQEAVRGAARAMGGLTHLVNNAGVGNLSSLDDTEPALWERLVRVNLTGVYHGIRAAAPLMREGGGGVVVNNASMSGVRPTRGELAYAAAKAGVIALTQGAALEYGPSIRVNCVSPGVIRTPMTEGLFLAPGLLEPVERATPLARTGSAEEVAEVVLFLCSDASRFMTGQNLIVDGGMSLPQAGIDDVLRGILPHVGKTRRKQRAD